MVVPRRVEWTRSARRHRIGRAHALAVMGSATPERLPATDTGPARLLWVGDDDRGLELEVVALEFDDRYLVIHVMPTQLRRKR